MLFPLFADTLYNSSFDNVFGNHESFLIVHKTGEYLIRATVQQSDESNPFLAVVLELHNVGFQLARTGGYDDRRLHTVAVCLILVIGGNQHARARTVAINGTALATAPPSLNVE
ncbi:hypothetical protein Barb7_01484 [Bacteroidales bacterium Barb7]|nr:hypothetical protein Barb7_01484 [Bacteroidales bacterium Barb7]